MYSMSIGTITGKLKNNQNKFREQVISVGDVIVFSSGRRLRLESIRFGDKQTLILINLKTGSVYRRKFKTESFPESEYDVVIHYKSLCYQLWQILEVFGLSEDKINSIEAYSN